MDKNIAESERPKAVSGAFILDENDRILLAKSYKWDNKWVVPGGHIEHGEKILDAAKREASGRTDAYPRARAGRAV